MGTMHVRIQLFFATTDAARSPNARDARYRVEEGGDRKVPQRIELNKHDYTCMVEGQNIQSYMLKRTHDNESSMRHLWQIFSMDMVCWPIVSGGCSS